jgi:Flp pilus assembly protein TadG
MLCQLRRERGQDLIEYALILPVLALLLFGIMEFGLVIFSYNTIGDAAREGARYGAVHCPSWSTTCNLTDISTAAKLLTTGLKQDAGHLTITPTHPTGTIRVEVLYKVDLIAFIVGSPSITLRAVSTMQTE